MAAEYFWVDIDTDLIVQEPLQRRQVRRLPSGYSFTQAALGHLPLKTLKEPNRGKRGVAPLEPWTSLHSSVRGVVGDNQHARCTFHSPSPSTNDPSCRCQSTTKVQKSPFGAPQTVQSRMTAKSSYVHKQVVQRNAEKNTPGINHFAMHRSSWDQHVLWPLWFLTNEAWL